MTKEKPIGLLVGLIIVIVFGIILTEFKGADAPFENVTDRPVIETDYYKTTDPPQPDLAFGPSPAEAEHAIHLASGDDKTPENEPIRIRVLPPRRAENNGPVAAVIRRNIDEDLTDSRSSTEPQPVQLEPPAQVAQREPASALPARSSVRTYRVEEGDTLTHIAAKVYGQDKGHLFTKIYEANRNQLADASSIYVGQVLTIPDAVEPTAPAVAAAIRTPDRARQVDLDGLRQFVQQPRTTTRRVYVVQSGDNLTRIARKVFNDASRDAVDRLFKANRDKLESPDNIVVGMTLQIPS